MECPAFCRPGGRRQRLGHVGEEDGGDHGDADTRAAEQADPDRDRLGDAVEQGAEDDRGRRAVRLLAARALAVVAARRSSSASPAKKARRARRQADGADGRCRRVRNASSVSSKATALMSTPAPKAMTRPITRFEMFRPSAISPPRSSDEPASSPHRNASVIARILPEACGGPREPPIAHCRRFLLARHRDAEALLGGDQVVVVVGGVADVDLDPVDACR